MQRSRTECGRWTTNQRNRRAQSGGFSARPCPVRDRDWPCPVRGTRRSECEPIVVDWSSPEDGRRRRTNPGFDWRMSFARPSTETGSLIDSQCPLHSRGQAPETGATKRNYGIGVHMAVLRARSKERKSEHLVWSLQKKT
ncbi:hypothetical protein BLNAU_4238 [Blattamonas nauphoetae]|uniref:Uncharacterized protein n=1 Tax=Blattamonas nauphoetae TaxID=2049346 RepID=A0ABQ9YAQ6_9EUKA|nr:hypothetical protein BLNAU_4238 [Blattamonas nauphoetae]